MPLFKARYNKLSSPNKISRTSELLGMISKIYDVIGQWQVMWLANIDNDGYHYNGLREPIGDLQTLVLKLSREKPYIPTMDNGNDAFQKIDK